MPIVMLSNKLEARIRDNYALHCIFVIFYLFNINAISVICFVFLVLITKFQYISLTQVHSSTLKIPVHSGLLI